MLIKITCSLCNKSWDDLESCVESDAIDKESFDKLSDDESNAEHSIECCQCTGKSTSWEADLKVDYNELSEKIDQVFEKMGRKTLRDFLPAEFMNGTYEKSQAMKYADVEVIARFEYSIVDDSLSTFKPWPGKHKNVYSWCSLANGKSVGWNENPSKGWSFPVMKTPEWVNDQIKNEPKE